jgi:hypothetical protein
MPGSQHGHPARSERSLRGVFSDVVLRPMRPWSRSEAAVPRRGRRRLVRCHPRDDAHLAPRPRRCLRRPRRGSPGVRRRQRPCFRRASFPVFLTHDEDLSVGVAVLQQLDQILHLHRVLRSGVVRGCAPFARYIQASFRGLSKAKNRQSTSPAELRVTSREVRGAARDRASHAARGRRHEAKLCPL